MVCTRVAKSDEDDGKKLRRVLAYIKCTIDYARVIGASSLQEIYIWVDVAYAIKSNMRSQSSGAISIGHAVLHCKSGKQKISVKSYTEAELVGVSNYLAYNIWAIMFMEGQGYPVEKDTL